LRKQENFLPLFFTMSDPIHHLQERIAYRFKIPNLLEQALTHASLETPSGNNQRLEFLGDAVLDLIVAEHLLRNKPKQSEGALDRMRAEIVNGKTLTKLAREIGLAHALRVSEAQRQHHSDPSDSMLEDALEAIIGAIYLDSGIDEAREVVHHIFGTVLEASDPDKARDPKSQLQEWTQAKHQGVTPEYRELPAEGPNHDRTHHASVHLGDKELGRGNGTSKKIAEHAAARAALQALELT
jgi:ribonuclease-3